MWEVAELALWGVMIGKAVRTDGGPTVNSGLVIRVNKRFGIYRWTGHRVVAGWLAPEVLDILGVLDSFQRSASVSGAVAEIGVHHGRLFIGLNLLQRDDEPSVAIDVFGDQDLNVDESGKGDLAMFRKNVQRWSSPENVVVHQGDSTQLQAGELRKLAQGGIRLFSVDGGHTDPIVFSDMNLAEATLAAGGIVIADDVFNQDWPGVSTGTLRYMESGGELVPFAIGFNKVCFSTQEYSQMYRDILRREFASRYLVLTKSSEFAGHEVLIISRVPRRPREIARQSKIARGAYRRVQEWRGRPS
jgi:hypothetical protein